jgi:hypothetical protein
MNEPSIELTHEEAARLSEDITRALEPIKVKPGTKVTIIGDPSQISTNLPHSYIATEFTFKPETSTNQN